MDQEKLKRANAINNRLTELNEVYHSIDNRREITISIQNEYDTMIDLDHVGMGIDAIKEIAKHCIQAEINILQTEFAAL